MSQPIPYCGPAPVPGELLARWNLDPVLLAGLAIVAACYMADWAWRTGRQRGEVVAFAMAWSVAVLLFVSPLCAWSSSLFSVRIAHHVVLITIVAPLLALARPLPGIPTRLPVFALQAVVLWTWHAPGPYAAALAHNGVFWLMQLSLLGTAILAWRIVLVPDGVAGAGRAIAGLLGTIGQMGLLGGLITFAGRPLYAPHRESTAAWGLTALEDQQLGGLLMWVPAMLPYMVAGLWIGNALLRGAAAANARGAR